MPIHSNKAFTLMELMVVMVILGIVVTIAVPNFNSMIERGQVQDAKNNLLAIYAGQQSFFARNGAYYASAACDPAAVAHDSVINDTANGLGVPVVPNNLSYCCDNTDASGFICYAFQETGNNFLMQVTNVPVVLSNVSPYPECGASENPCCDAASPCP